MTARQMRLFAWTTILSVAFVAANAAAQQQQRNGGPPAAPPQPNGVNNQIPEAVNNQFTPTYYPETYYSSYYYGYPAPEVRSVPDAMAVAAVAGAEYRRAQGNLGLLVLEMRKAWQRSRDYVSAANEEREAYDALEASRRAALRTLADDPGYQASISLRDQMTQQIEARRNDKHATLDEIVAMARVKMDYAATASAMEAAALSASPDYQQARERLRRASARLSDMRYEFDQTVRTSPEVIAARQSASDLRIAKLGADVYLTGARESRDIALRYAVWAGRYDRFRYLHYRPVYTYGYPIGWTGRPLAW